MMSTSISIRATCGPQEMVDEQSRRERLTAAVLSRAQTWQRLVSPDGRTRSLVLHGSSATVVVSADLPYEALEAYASTLSTTS